MIVEQPDFKTVLVGTVLDRLASLAKTLWSTDRRSSFLVGRGSEDLEARDAQYHCGLCNII